MATELTLLGSGVGHWQVKHPVGMGIHSCLAAVKYMLLATMEEFAK